MTPRKTPSDASSIPRTPITKPTVSPFRQPTACVILAQAYADEACPARMAADGIPAAAAPVMPAATSGLTVATAIAAMVAVPVDRKRTACRRPACERTKSV